MEWRQLLIQVYVEGTEALCARIVQAGERIQLIEPTLGIDVRFTDNEDPNPIPLQVTDHA